MQLKTVDPKFFLQRHNLAVQHAHTPSQRPIHWSPSPCNTVSIPHSVKSSQAENLNPPGHDAKTLATVPAHEHGWGQLGEAVLLSDGAYSNSGTTNASATASTTGSAASCLQEIESALESCTAIWLDGLTLENTQALEAQRCDAACICSGRSSRESEQGREAEQPASNPPRGSSDSHSLDPHLPATGIGAAVPTAESSSCCNSLTQRSSPPDKLGSSAGSRNPREPTALSSGCSVKREGPGESACSCRGRLLLFHWLLSLPPSLVARWFAQRRKCRRLGEEPSEAPENACHPHWWRGGSHSAFKAP